MCHCLTSNLSVLSDVNDCPNRQCCAANPGNPLIRRIPVQTIRTWVDEKEPNVKHTLTLLAALLLALPAALRADDSLKDEAAALIRARAEAAKTFKNEVSP